MQVQINYTVDIDPQAWLDKFEETLNEDDIEGAVWDYIEGVIVSNLQYEGVWGGSYD